MSLTRRPASVADRPNDGREFAFDTSDFRQIAGILYADSGIFLSDEKTSLVYARLVKRMRALGLESFKDYCRLIADDSGLEERQEMLRALTTNVTSFFREKHHFDYMKSNDLPALLKSAREGGRVRIWSAGCSRGHEPYSMAMTVLSLMPDAGKYDIKILATDIDSAVTATGRTAVYEMDELGDIPKADFSRWFQPVAGGKSDTFTVNEDLRRLVSFRELNLIGQWPMKGRFNIIFCRNVMIYFDAPTQVTLCNRFAGALAPGGLLCIGHSERVAGAALDRFTATGTTMYRLNGGART